MKRLISLIIVIYLFSLTSCVSDDVSFILKNNKEKLILSKDYLIEFSPNELSFEFEEVVMKKISRFKLSEGEFDLLINGELLFSIPVLDETHAIAIYEPHLHSVNDHLSYSENKIKIYSCGNHSDKSLELWSQKIFNKTVVKILTK